MKATISALSDEDAAKTIDRDGFAMPVELQLDVYLQALLIIVTHCERHIVSDITCLIISRTPTKIHILRSGLEWSVECLPENTTDRPPYIISKIMPILVNCDDAGTSIEHVGPLRLLVPMHFTHTTGSQAYIYACQCRCK